jgi:2-keto-4-pentenoate hydratase
MKELVTEMAAAVKSRSALPRMPADLDLNRAYDIQKQLVEQVAPGDVSGLKAGMTAAAGQKAFGLTHPLIGSLYGFGRLEPGVTFASGTGISLECEIGVIVDATGKPKSAGPVIEVPRMAWGHPDDAIGTNLTACNIAADRYIVGTQQDFREDYDDVEIQLTRDGTVVCEAPASDALGGPQAALDWMLQEASARGLQLVDDMLLITGACGGIHAAQPGHYVADYGSLGTIEFTVT